MMYNPAAKAQGSFLQASLPFLTSNNCPWEGPLEVSLVFHFKRPKSHYGTGKNEKVLKKNNLDAWHCKRKDLDNLIKFVLDALNRRAYMDDSQISMISSAKVYTEGASRVEVGLRRLTPHCQMIVV
jgi:Holliday junction resolvase RusA-like endonuclease